MLAKRERQMAEAQSLIDEARVKNQQMFLGAAKAQMEEKHFDQLLLGAERELRENRRGRERNRRPTRTLWRMRRTCGSS